MIEIHDLYKFYGHRRAVGPLSATIQTGEVVGLLGLNGAGKTTTLRILACDLLPTSGTVRIDGVDVVENPLAVRASTGYLPDTPPLYSEMTVAEYLAFAARLRGIPSGSLERVVNQALSRTRLDQRSDDVIATLSHGFKQRLGIAQAIVHEPKLVVLDEPINGLDPVQIVEMRKLIREIGKEHTVVVSSHNLLEISETCDRILVITNGVVTAAGTEAELSAKWLKRVRVAVTVQSSPTHSREAVQSLLGNVPGAVGVHNVDATEQGEHIWSYEVEAEKDIRDALGRAVIGADLCLLELRRSERALESVFLQLARAEAEGAVAHEEAE